MTRPIESLHSVGKSVQLSEPRILTRYHEGHHISPCMGVVTAYAPLFRRKGVFELVSLLQIGHVFYFSQVQSKFRQSGYQIWRTFLPFRGPLFTEPVFFFVAIDDVILER